MWEVTQDSAANNRQNDYTDEQADDQKDKRAGK